MNDGFPMALAVGSMVLMGLLILTTDDEPSPPMPPQIELTAGVQERGDCPDGWLRVTAVIHPAHVDHQRPIPACVPPFPELTGDEPVVEVELRDAE